MSIEEAKRLYKYGEKQYDELTDEQKKFVDNYWEAMFNIFARILTTTRPYKAKLPQLHLCVDNRVDYSRIKPPRNYREEHNQFIERLIYIQEEKDKRIDVTSMYPRMRIKE